MKVTTLKVNNSANEKPKKLKSADYLKGYDAGAKDQAEVPFLIF